MANAKQQENMLLTEHFTWPPISLIDDIINAVNEVLYRCTDSFETGLLAADPALLGFADRYANEGRTIEKDEDGTDSFPEARLEVEEGVLKLETLLENAVDRNFDRLEIWTLRNVFSLAAGGGRGDEELVKWMRLGHYEGVEPLPKNSQLTPEALYTLRRKLVETQKLNAALLAEKKRNEDQLVRLRALLQPSNNNSANTTTTTTTSAPFSFLTHTPSSQSLGIQPLPQTPPTTTSSQPLTTHTTFTTSQLPALKQLLAGLKPHLATTALPSSASEKSEGEEVIRERKAYVESQSKRILERRGVDTRDGVEGVWDGRRVGAEEVRGLEGLVGGMSRGRKEVGSGSAGDVVETGEGDGDAMDTS